MTPALVYWVAVAALGLVAAIGSLAIGLGYFRRLAPDLRQHYWPENVRDVLLVLGLGCNLLVGILATVGPIRSGTGLIAVLGGATCLSVFAIFNFLLRIP